MSAKSGGTQDEKLIRALGVPTLTASIVNATIGAGIFVLPAVVAGGLGAAAPIAFVICALAMALVVTSFAIAGSRVSLTGGLYAYVEVAFGSYVGFLAGVLLWLTNVLAVAGVASAFAASVALIVPAAQGGVGRFILLVLIFLILAIINIRGVRAGADTVAAMTVAKLLPLLLFIVVGLFFIKPSSLGWSVWPGADAIGRSVAVLIFAFMGVELALVPSGEVKNPSRTVPRSVFLALAVTTAIYIAIQLVAQGVLGSTLSNFADAPLAEAHPRFLETLAVLSCWSEPRSQLSDMSVAMFSDRRERFMPSEGTAFCRRKWRRFIRATEPRMSRSRCTRLSPWP